jgi:agmatinase
VPSGFNVNAPAAKDSGAFGLTTQAVEARVIGVPVPFEATVSYGAGTANGPTAILAASHQVDLLDADVGRPYLAGIAMVDAMPGIRELNDEARVAAMRVIDAQTEGRTPSASDIRLVDDAGARINDWLGGEIGRILAAGKLPFVLGGDHSIPLAAIQACARTVGSSGQELGVLHLDAHCDLRTAYEGFRFSHASIMKNVLDTTDNVRIVQVGIRDFSESELDVVKQEPTRVTTYFDAQLRRMRLSADGGVLALWDRIAAAMPDQVYLSFDIDGLDPALCPNTGTPVPGGLSFDAVVALLDALVRAQKRIIGMDLVEVAPGPDLDDLGASWDANVAARLLYKMIGFALMSHGEPRVELPRPPGI